VVSATKFKLMLPELAFLLTENGLYETVTACFEEFSL